MKDIDYVTQRVAKMTTPELAKLSELAGVGYTTVSSLRWPGNKTANPTTATLTKLADTLRKHRVIDTTQPATRLLELAERRRQKRQIKTIRSTK